MQSDPTEGQSVVRITKRVIMLYADRSSRQWVVQDPEGAFWIIPPGDEPWSHRQPFIPGDETELEPVPGHYKSMLGLPF